MITTIILILHILIVIGVSIKVIFRRLPVGSSLAWILIIGTVPFVGFLIYMLIGDHRMGRRRMRLGDLVRRYYQKSLEIADGAVKSHPEIDDPFMRIGRVAAKDTGFHVRRNNELQILSQPEQMFTALIEDIQSAEQSCYLEFYIIDPEARVDAVLAAIAEAAKRGVDCKIVADHVGSRKFFKSDWPERLSEAGVDVIHSLPVGVIKTFFIRSDLRNHRKIVVIDRLISYTGSFNLADPDVFNRGKNCGPWVDIFVRMKGDVTESLSAVFHTDHVLDTYERKNLGRIPSLPDIETYHAEGIFGDKPLQIIPSGPEMASSVIYETIVSSIYSAQKYIYITTPYLIPDEPLLLALTNASRRGVDVKIIVPKRVDSMLVRFASHSYYGTLLVAGVEIFEFEDGLMHTKAVLIDDSVCYVGTVNLDMRSFYLNLEITLAIYGDDDCRLVKDVVKDYMTNSEQVSKEDWLDGKRSKPVIFAENLVRLASPLL